MLNAPAVGPHGEPRADRVVEDDREAALSRELRPERLGELAAARYLAGPRELAYGLGRKLGGGPAVGQRGGDVLREELLEHSRDGLPDADHDVARALADRLRSAGGGRLGILRGVGLRALRALARLGEDLLGLGLRGVDNALRLGLGLLDAFAVDLLQQALYVFHFLPFLFDG